MQLGWYLNFSTWFMKNIFQQKIQNYETNGFLWEIKQIMQYVLKWCEFPCCLNYLK